MREGCYEALLIVNDRVAEERYINGNVYCIAKTGAEYIVRVTVYKDPFTDKFPAPYLRIGLFVDGHDVNYWKRISFAALESAGIGSPASKEQNSVSVVFWGFSKNQTEMSAFVFSKPLESAESSYSGSSSSKGNMQPFGQIKVIIHEASVTIGMHQNVSKALEVPVASAIDSDGVKFWKQPSVATAAGRVMQGKETFLPLEKWRNKDVEPLQTLLLYYHTEEKLNQVEDILLNVSSPLKKPRLVDNTYSHPLDLSADNTQGDCEVEIVPVVKEIPMLDLSQEEDQDRGRALHWTTINKVSE